MLIQNRKTENRGLLTPKPEKSKEGGSSRCEEDVPSCCCTFPLAWCLHLHPNMRANSSFVNLPWTTHRKNNLSYHWSPEHLSPQHTILEMPFMHGWPDFRLFKIGTKISFIWSSDKEPTCKWRRHKRCWFNPWVGKIPWRRKWQTHSSTHASKIPWTEESGGL